MGGEEQLYIVFLGQFLHELGEANQQSLVDRAVYLVNAQYAVGAIGEQQGTRKGFSCKLRRTSGG